jgi:hypothetical protein
LLSARLLFNNRKCAFTSGSIHIVVGQKAHQFRVDRIDENAAALQPLAKRGRFLARPAYIEDHDVRLHPVSDPNARDTVQRVPEKLCIRMVFP